MEEKMESSYLQNLRFSDINISKLNHINYERKYKWIFIRQGFKDKYQRQKPENKLFWLYKNQILFIKDLHPKSIKNS